MVRRVRLAAIALLAAFAIFGLLAVAQVSAQDAATPIAAEPSAATGTVWVFVVDEHGAPLAGADVTLFQGEDELRVGRTGPEGNIGFDDLEPGTYSGVVVASGRGPTDFGPFDVLAGEVAEPTVTLLPLAEVTIKVTNQGGSPVTGATISLATGNSSISGTTSKEGSFVFKDLAAGPYGGSVIAPGYGHATIKQFELKDGDRVQIDVVLPPPPPGSIQLTVTDDKGVPLPNAHIDLYPTNDNQTRFEQGTDSTGKALFNGLKAGEYYALIYVKGYDGTFADNITVEPGRTTYVLIKTAKLPPPTTGTFSVRVVLGSEPVNGEGSVSIYGKTSLSMPLNKDGDGDGNGQVIFTGVQPGVYAIKVDTQDLGSKTIGPIQVAAGQELDEVIDLSKPSPGSTGTVIIETFSQEEYPRPVANVAVTIRADNFNYDKTLVTDAQGVVIFLDAPADHYSLDGIAYDANNKPYDGPGGNFRLAAGDVVEQTLHIDNAPAPGTALLAIAVTDEQGAPISGASVSVESAIDTVQLQTGPSGYAFASDLPPGTVTVRASAAGYADGAPMTISAQAGATTEITIQLSPVQGPAPEPTPEPGQTPAPGPTPAAPVVVQLPSTGAGSGSASVPATMALALVLAVVVVLAGFARLTRSAPKSRR
jgi:protocatechuate 3,4-dioxygenase beta subunit